MELYSTMVIIVVYSEGSETKGDVNKDIYPASLVRKPSKEVQGCNIAGNL